MLCHALRRLANNIQEPSRTLSLQAIDASIKWWQGKPAPQASALRAPVVESKSPTHLDTISSEMASRSFGLPSSFKTVFIKHAAVLDQLCNHKQAISQWSTDPNAICCCQHFGPNTKKPPSTHQTPTGSWQVRFFMTCFRQILPSLPRDLC